MAYYDNMYIMTRSQDERIISYLPLSHVAGMLLDIVRRPSAVVRRALRLRVCCDVM